MLDFKTLIAQRAALLGFPSDVAVAVATLESGADGIRDYGDPTIDERGWVDPVTGQRFASLGPFQENVVGGAGETHLRRGGTIDELFDPVSATDRFVARYQGAADVAFLGETPGQIAARAQRPANPTAYAAAVDSLIAQMDGVPRVPVTAAPAPSAPAATGIVGTPANTGAASPAASCRPLNVAEIAFALAQDKLGRSAHDIAQSLGMTDECLRQNVYRVAGGLPDPGGDIARGITGGVLGALPTVAILAVILVLAYKGVSETIES